ncbi:substrate-binding periplasmic protein [Roseitranquillus sediminis]|uniref:substrate-binding periplasmic protein n=1 Tax=Roseitranquillus sediminis TaxID=2809051 RepID=UPI001D0C2713|nr:transporter substrate-binding domain-containing protein [Roseitranquillus sediminis]MBM9594478.1 transporter substrate-binding domain-containing protein [Roseitranquillus sediminis]
MRDEPNLRADIGGILAVVALFACVAFLPPDTSLSEMRKDGTLKACLPSNYPPLVISGAERPGFDVELLAKVADRLGVRLSLNRNDAIGRDFNPRSWGLNRAQCQVVAGGVAVTDTTRTFLDTTEPHLATGWILIGREAVPASLDGLTVGVFPGVAGRDRVALTSGLRQEGARIAPAHSIEDLATRLAAGELDAGVTEALAGGSLAAERGWSTAWLLGSDEADPIAFGLWKGDLTLKRAVGRALEGIREDGEIEALRRIYSLPSISAVYAGAGA